MHQILFRFFVNLPRNLTLFYVCKYILRKLRPKYRGSPPATWGGQQHPQCQLIHSLRSFSQLVLGVTHGTSLRLGITSPLGLRGKADMARHVPTLICRLTLATPLLRLGITSPLGLRGKADMARHVPRSICRLTLAVTPLLRPLSCW